MSKISLWYRIKDFLADKIIGLMFRTSDEKCCYAIGLVCQLNNKDLNDFTEFCRELNYYRKKQSEVGNEN